MKERKIGDKTLSKDAELVATVRDRFNVMEQADRDNMRAGQADMKFINIPGAQWDQNQKHERGNRPCYEFNKLRINAKRIINHIRTNPPQGKVKGVEGTDKKQAEYREGLIRNIWNMSNGDSIVSSAAEFQVGAGKGSWRITTDYADDGVFDQDIKVEPILNPFCLFNDPAAKDMLKRDAHDWILTEKIPKHVYEDKYPDKEVVSFEDHEFDDDEDWQDEDTVRIAEYWYKEPTTKEIWQLEDGAVIDAEEDEALIIEQTTPERIKKRRTVKTHKIMWVIVSGDAILEGPEEWAGSMHPFVNVYGESMVIDGKLHWFGIGRFAQDAQRSYNVSRTAITETIMSAPLSFDWVTTTQAEGNTNKWAEAHKKNFPFKIYNPDPLSPGPPMRGPGPDVPVALIQESQIASQEIDDVTGIFGDDRGQESASQSGRAIYARQEQGQVVTYNYPDNIAKAIAYTWELLLDLIPNVYDTERELRIIGQDGEEDYLTINQFVDNPEDPGNPIKINDMSVGRYDVTISTGPSFSTKRQEFVETFSQIFGNDPQIYAMYGDLIFKAMDLPYSDEMAERAKMLLPPEIQKSLNEEQEMPPEVQIMIQQAEQGMARVEEAMALAQQEAQAVGLEKAEVEKMTAELETKVAKFEAQVQKEIANIAKMKSELTIQAVNNEKQNVIEEGLQVVEQEKQDIQSQMMGELARGIESIQQMAANFSVAAVETLADVQEESKKKPKLVKFRTYRENGNLVGEPEFEEQ